jgi:hypothetical protein
MRAILRSTLAILSRRRTRGWAFAGVAVLSSAIASIATAKLLQAHQAADDNSRVYELAVYHTPPGKVPALITRFEDADGMLATHGIHVLGYWSPEGNPAWDNTFVYLIAHSSRAEADRNWKAFHDDPGFRKYVVSERADKLIDHDERVFMRPTRYSAMK